MAFTDFRKMIRYLKLIYSEKATKFCEISTVDLTVTTSMLEILQKLVAFSEYMNFNAFSAAPFLARKRIETFKKNVILPKSAEPV